MTRIASSKGNAPFGLILGSSDRAKVFILSTIAMTCVGVLVIRHVSGSRSAERC